MSSPSEEKDVREANLAWLKKQVDYDRMGWHNQQRFNEIIAALQSAEQRATKLAEEVERLRMAIMGGEDAPGYAMSLTLDTVLKVAAENNRLWMAASDRATAAEAQLAGVVEIANRFPEINPSNYGSDEVDALNAWGIEVVQALASINSTAPVGEEKPENEVREKLRAAWMRVQAAKRKGGAGLQPLWDVVNLVPAVLYELDHMAAFEQDAQAEEFAALPAQDVGGLEAGDVEWLRAALPKVHPNLHGINPPEMIAANEAVNARIDRLIAALSIKPQERS